MGTVNIRDTAQWASLLRAEPLRPLLVHLNGDTTWLLQLPIPPGASRDDATRTHFNLLIDPWLQGPQSDVAAWFSTQHHIVTPAVESLAELQAALRGLQPTGTSGTAAADGATSSYIDAVAISHEFTDHCHKATLLELPRNTPIYAADVAADLIRSWKYFDGDAVITAPGLGRDVAWTSLSHEKLPAWLRVSRLITPGNSLYYHSALIVAFGGGSGGSSAAPAEAVVYSPHGISAADVAALPSSGLSTLAMMHGLHDVRLFMMKQLNLGALNAIEAVRASGATYWIGTHDEEKTGKGLIAPLLRRTRYTLRQAVAHDENKRRKNGEETKVKYDFRELASGDALLLQ
ncbi:hypothetical protein PWT90_02285 [Aphanocladium album]|nr:hypothetical protein PWT90_02285 [Aphanocladium album]